MDKQLIERLINFRQQLHMYPQTAFKQFQTQQRIKKILIQLGLSEKDFKHYQPTGVSIDISGLAQPQGKSFCVAFRADMDALSMTEDNEFSHKSRNHGAAHMCGHDGHMTCLVAFVPLFLKQLKKIPSNKKIRLLFQPSQQGPFSGAKKMIQQGCLQDVDQVYGFHNWPIDKFGDILCKQGPVMSCVTVIDIKIIGTGGHGSTPKMLKVAIWKAVQFYQQFQSFLAQYEKITDLKGIKWVCTLPVFQSGQRYNVISQSVKIGGTLRTFDQQTRQHILNKLKELIEKIKANGFTCQYSLHSTPAVINSKKQADNVIRVAKQFAGQEKAGPGILPMMASEDFSYYTQHKPGAFFFLCHKKSENEVMLHNSRFDFKDELIQYAANFWLKLAQDRLLSQ